VVNNFLGGINGMKTFITVVLLLTLFFLLFLYGSASAERRARFLNTKIALLEAHIELQRNGGFTNYFRDINVYPCTNQITFDSTNYQCEFAVESEEFRQRGFLTITTNGVFFWVDKKYGLIPLVRPKTYPPGL
jgi:hypothetical protein